MGSGSVWAPVLASDSALVSAWESASVTASELVKEQKMEWVRALDLAMVSLWEQWDY